VVCNIVARELLKFFATLKPEEVAQWYRENKDLSELLPVDFEIPNGIKGKIAKEALKKLTEHSNGTYPAYDLILQNLHDMAAFARQVYLNAKDEESAEVMRRVQVIAAFLGNDRVKPWYYSNVNNAYRKIAPKVGVDDGATGSD
jgi:hypothetical protein